MAKPVLYTRKSLAAEAAKRWANQYRDEETHEWRRQHLMFTDTEKVYNWLVELGKDPDPDDVDAVIGNKTWTRVTCDACVFSGYGEGPWVQVGQEPDYDSCTATLCIDCFKEASQLLEEACDT